MARYLCDAFDEVTKQCVQWSEYTPLIPELSQEMIATIWGYFLLSMVSVWCAKKLIRLFGG